MNTIFTLSIWGSLLTLLVLIIGLFTKNRFYKTLQYYMWLIVLVRFIIPFFPEITIKTTSTLQHTVIPQQLNVSQEMLTPVDIDNNYEVPTQDIVVKNKIDILKLIKDYIGVMYLIGFITVTILNISVYINFKIKVFKYNINVDYNEIYTFVFNRCKHQLKIKRKIKLFLNSYISTPMLVGIFKPTVLIPEEKFEEEDLELVFKHELMHYKRKDMLVKHIANLAVCIHWFNPLIYLVRNQIDKYCELSCDETVIKILDKQYYKAYGDIILRIAQSNIDKSIAFVSTLNGDKNILKERLVLIMNYKKVSKKAIALSTSLLISMSTVAVFSGTTFASSQATTVDSTQYKRFDIEDLTQEEIDLFTDIFDRYEEKSDKPLIFNVYKFSRELSDTEMELLKKYRDKRPKPKNNIPIDDKSAEFYYDTNEFSFILPDRDLTEEEILEYYYLIRRMSLIQSQRMDKLREEEQNKELEKLTDKDISKEKAEEIAKAEIKKFFPEIDSSTLVLRTIFDSKLKMWQTDMYTKDNQKEFSPRVQIDSQTGKVIMMYNIGRIGTDSINLEEAKKTDIWKTEAEKFLKDYLGETRTPTSIFSYASVIYDDNNGMQPVAGDTVKVLFKYDDNTSYKIHMSYDTHKIIGYEHERIVDLNNRFDIPNIYVDKPQDVKFLITVYK